MLGLVSLLADGVFDPSPPYGWRRGHYLGFRCAISATILALYLWVSWHMTSWTPQILLFPLGALAFFGVQRTGIAKRAAFIDNLIMNNCSCCTNCAYVLVVDSESGVCPECGTAYSLNRCQETWRCWILKPGHRSLVGVTSWTLNRSRNGAP